MPQGPYNYANSLGIKPKAAPKPLDPGQNIPDPTKVNTTQGTDYNKRVTQNLANPGRAVTAIGGRVEQDTMDNLNAPDKNRSEFGNTYDANLTKEAASGKLYGMDNAEAMARRNQGLNASRQVGQTQESLASRGIMPGTAAYARSLGMTQAAVGAQNLAIDQNLNTQQVAASKDINSRLAGREDLAGSRYADALNNATTFEANAQNREQVAMGQAKGIEDQAYNKGQTAFQQGETARLENKAGQTALINSVTDPRTKALLQGVANSGGDVQEAFNGIMGITGDIKNAGTVGEQFRSQNPAQAEKEGLMAQAKAYNPKQAGETDIAYQARMDKLVNDQGNKIFTSKNAPLDQQEKERVSVGIQETLNTLPKDKMLDSTQFETARKNGVVKQFSSETLPRNPRDVNKFLLDNPSGIVSLNGEQYKVVSGSSPRTGRSKYTNSPRHTDVAMVMDSQGNKKYVYGGKVNDKPPKTVGDVQITPFGW